MSGILILHFFLDLRERHAHFNGTSQLGDLETVSPFMAVIHSISNAIVEDLGDPEYKSLFTIHITNHNSSITGEISQPIRNDSMENSNTVPSITIEEFPWVDGLNRREI